MRAIYLDCFSGIAGDMLVGALLDLGASIEGLRAGLSTLPLEDHEIAMREVARGPIRAVKFDVRIGGCAADTPAARSGSHHLPARGLREIRALLEPSSLSPRVKTRALRAFELLARAEAEVHGADPEEIHFHEVGAVDAICDIVGVALALEDLDVETVHAGPLAVGSGFITCAHGILPVPGPAAMACLAGFDVRLDSGRGELVTPTGAALLASLATAGAPAPFVVARTGYGAGTRDTEDVPNVLRAVMGETPGGGDSESLVELRTNVDHLPPTILAAACERVLAAGALDVYTTPCTMKKGRSGHLVTALVAASRRAAVEEALFSETGTLGVRAVPVERTVLARKFETVATPWGPVRVKVGRHLGRVTSREPEFEDCRRLAEQHGVPLAEVVAAARR